GLTTGKRIRHPCRRSLRSMKPRRSLSRFARASLAIAGAFGAARSVALTPATQVVTINPGPAQTFTVAGFPSPVTAGTAGSVTVTAKDAYGNTATGYAGTVHFTASDVQAALPANSTLTSGVGTFSATLKTVGSQSITATDSVLPTPTGSQTAIT